MSSYYYKYVLFNLSCIVVLYKVCLGCYMQSQDLEWTLYE